MPSQPLISVIIPAYNAESTIREAVESVLSQTYRPLEIIIIDDGSSDGTYEAVENLHPDVKVLRQSNAGPSVARNYGIREANGIWIAFLDADDRWLPEKLSKQWNRVCLNEKIGFVHTDVMFFDTETNRQWQKAVGRDNFVGHCTDKLLKENRVLTSSVIMKRVFLEKSGLFDEQFWVAEDYDLWLRLSTLCEFAYIPEPLVEYRVQSESLSTSSLRMRKSELAVVQKAMLALSTTTSPSMGLMLSPPQLRSRLQELNWDIGSLAFESQDFLQARTYLGQTIKLDPTNFRAIYLWLSTWLPSGVIARMKQWKQSLSTSADRAVAL